MHGYVTFEAGLNAAASAAGSPPSPGSVTTIPGGGYQISSSNGQGGTTVVTFTLFRHDAAGRVTGLDVNGQPIAGRLATGPDSQGRLQITGVAAYKPAAFNELSVVFHVTNTGGPLINGDFLVNFAPAGGGSCRRT
jgi:hypothetical protein